MATFAAILAALAPLAAIILFLLRQGEGATKDQAARKTAQKEQDDADEFAQLLQTAMSDPDPMKRQRAISDLRRRESE